MAQPNIIPIEYFNYLRKEIMHYPLALRNVILGIKEYPVDSIKCLSKSDDNNGGPRGELVTIFCMRFLHTQMYQPLLAIIFSSLTSFDHVNSHLRSYWTDLIQDLVSLKLNVVATLSSMQSRYIHAIEEMSETKLSAKPIIYRPIPRNPTLSLLHLFDINSVCHNFEKWFFNSENVSYFLEVDMYEKQYRWRKACSYDIKRYFRAERYPFKAHLSQEPIQILNSEFFYKYVLFVEQDRTHYTENSTSTCAFLSICCPYIEFMNSLSLIETDDLLNITNSFRSLKMLLSTGFTVPVEYQSYNTNPTAKCINKEVTMFNELVSNYKTSVSIKTNTINTKRWCERVLSTFNDLRTNNLKKVNNEMYENIEKLNIGGHRFNAQLSLFEYLKLDGLKHFKNITYVREDTPPPPEKPSKMQIFSKFFKSALANVQKAIKSKQMDSPNDYIEMKTFALVDETDEQQKNTRDKQLADALTAYYTNNNRDQANKCYEPSKSEYLNPCFKPAQNSNNKNVYDINTILEWAANSLRTIEIGNDKNKEFDISEIRMTGAAKYSLTQMSDIKISIKNEIETGNKRAKELEQLDITRVKDNRMKETTNDELECEVVQLQPNIIENKSETFVTINRTKGQKLNCICNKPSDSLKLCPVCSVICEESEVNEAENSPDEISSNNTIDDNNDLGDDLEESHEGVKFDDIHCDIISHKAISNDNDDDSDFGDNLGSSDDECPPEPLPADYCTSKEFLEQMYNIFLELPTPKKNDECNVSLPWLSTLNSFETLHQKLIQSNIQYIDASCFNANHIDHYVKLCNAQITQIDSSWPSAFCRNEYLVFRLFGDYGDITDILTKYLVPVKSPSNVSNLSVI